MGGVLATVGKYSEAIDAFKNDSYKTRLFRCIGNIGNRYLYLKNH